MITEKFQVEKKEKTEYPSIPKDIYPVELLDITSEIKPTYDTRNKPEEEQEKENILSFQFTILKGKDGETDLRGRNVWANFIPTYLWDGKNGKNKLWKIVEAINARELTPEDEATMDQDYLNNLIGKACRISVEPKTKGDNTYDNITDWLKLSEPVKELTDEEKGNSKVTKKEEEKEDTSGNANVDGVDQDISKIPF